LLRALYHVTGDDFTRKPAAPGRPLAAHDARAKTRSAASRRVKGAKALDRHTLPRLFAIGFSQLR
jgi:hypothetical protein